VSRLEIFPIVGVGEIAPGDDVAALLLEAADAAGTPLAERDCVVVTQKVVSKAEGRLVPLDPDDLAARQELVERESVRIVRRRGDLVISETRHGFVCANAGIDLSNVAHGFAALLPADADVSAHRLRQRIRAQRGIDVAVVVSDTFGRPWRQGVTDVAIGVSGLAAVVDLRGTPDAHGRILQVTEVCVADEVASAAELVMGKARGYPAAVLRGLDPAWFGDGRAADIVRPAAEDLFR
jgi:coenzyme F420-0:L-glutamate ligase/coenzyme F420-1:gamma-L-glutamate ligase